MKIILDPEVFHLGNCGLTRYYSALYKGLLDKGVNIDCPVYLSGNDYFPFKQPPFFNYLPPKVKKLYVKFLKQKSKNTYFKKIASGQYDVIFVTSQDFEIDFLKYKNNTPYIMTAHDTMTWGAQIPYSYIDTRNQAMNKMAYLANYADRIISVSNYTKNDLTNFYSIDEEKIKVIHLANFLEGPADESIVLPEKYILFVGERTGRKNFNFFFQSIVDLLKKVEDLSLVVTGQLYEWEEDYFKRMGCGGKVIGRDANDAQLVTLYKKAICFVYPTFYEGFGLPVLEAMANDCPVIVSANSSLPEVGGDAVFYIDPSSKQSIGDAVRKVVDNDDDRKELIKKAKKRVEMFSVDNMLNKTVDSLEELVKQH
ncbi:MAG: glycosyltransferase family 4 protein [Desulfobacteraceae bacterium]|nr:glycosyltransferase family 4 protein [Desulfobacteraceae bacterium]MBC2757860.1 glycosyltransferase family 4 protein [Desulfobacteraceae bacterium]